jgi:hypothetical protein
MVKSKRDTDASRGEFAKKRRHPTDEQKGACPSPAEEAATDEEKGSKKGKDVRAQENGLQQQQR